MLISNQTSDLHVALNMMQPLRAARREKWGERLIHEINK